MSHDVWLPNQDETREDDDRLRHDRDGSNDLVEVGRDLDASNVEPDKDEDPDYGFDEPQPGQVDRSDGRREIGDVVAEGDPGQEVVEVAERDHGEEGDIDGVVAD